MEIEGPAFMRCPRRFVAWRSRHVYHGHGTVRHDFGNLTLRLLDEKKIRRNPDQRDGAGEEEDMRRYEGIEGEKSTPPTLPSADDAGDCPVSRRLMSGSMAYTAPLPHSRTASSKCRRHGESDASGGSDEAHRK